MQGLPERNRDNRAEFTRLLKEQTDVPDGFLTYLDTTDFFKAPASTKYHDNHEGGLLQHSLNVYEKLTQLNYQFLMGFSDSSVIKTSLLHDVCKIGFYKREHRNVRLEDGRWIRKEVWIVEDQLPLGHGEKSVAVLLQNGVPLTEEEMLAIRWHMLSFDDSSSSYGGGQALSNAMNKSKLVSALHIADLMSTWLNGDTC